MVQGPRTKDGQSDYPRAPAPAPPLRCRGRWSLPATCELPAGCPSSSKTGWSEDLLGLRQRPGRAGARDLCATNCGRSPANREADSLGPTIQKACRRRRTIGPCCGGRGEPGLKSNWKPAEPTRSASRPLLVACRFWATLSMAASLPFGVQHEDERLRSIALHGRSRAESSDDARAASDRRPAGRGSGVPGTAAGGSRLSCPCQLTLADQPRGQETKPPRRGWLRGRYA